MRKLLIDVIRLYLEKSGVSRGEAGNFIAYIENADGKENKRMFEASIESIIEARETARKQGIEQGRLETARNALAEGASAEFVQKISGLDMEAVKKMHQNKRDTETRRGDSYGEQSIDKDKQG